MFGSGTRCTFARTIRSQSAVRMMAPSILASSESRWGVNSASRRNPPEQTDSTSGPRRRRSAHPSAPAGSARGRPAVGCPARRDERRRVGPRIAGVRSWRAAHDTRRSRDSTAGVDVGVGVGTGSTADVSVPGATGSSSRGGAGPGSATASASRATGAFRSDRGRGGPRRRPEPRRPRPPRYQTTSGEQEEAERGNEEHHRSRVAHTRARPDAGGRTGLEHDRRRTTPGEPDDDAHPERRLQLSEELLVESP